MKSLLSIIFVTFLLFGCGVQVVPRTSALTQFSPDKQSVVATENDITVSAKVQDLDFGPYTGVNNITAFYVSVSNNSSVDKPLPLTAFMLFDQDRKLYRPLEPERVTALTRQESNYLIPYPFVGFYYLKDSTDFDYSMQSASSLPYTRSQDDSASAESYALPVGVIPPNSHIAGMLYFNIDLYEKSNVELLFQLPADHSTPETRLSFVFDVVK